jgi:uncharacterized protein YndB with AHSA1/START domain
MTELVDDTTVRTSVEVPVGAERAFELFTTEIATWWDEDKHILRAPLADMVFEPFVGGQIIDRGVDGSECRWARVLSYEPPRRVCFSWDINLQWQLESDPERCSEVEITFEPTAETRTRVTLTHRRLDRHGPGWESMRDAVAGGWDLTSLRTRASGAARPGSAGHAQVHAELPASAEEAYAALTTLDGLRGWWTRDTQGDPTLDGEFILTFRSGNTTTMRVTRLDPPRRVEWTCVAQHIDTFDPPDEWLETRVIFDLVPAGATTRLTLTHEGLAWLECRSECIPGWEFYIGTSLPGYLQSGQGSPRDPSRARPFSDLEGRPSRA